MHMALESIMDDLDLTTFLVAQCKQGIFIIHMYALYAHQKGQSLFSGLDHWTGLLDWNTGLTFDPKNSIQKASFSPL